MDAATLSNVVQIILTLGGLLAVFLQTKWRGEANAAAIEALSRQVKSDHEKLAREQKDIARELGDRVNTLFSKQSELRTDQGRTDERVHALIPRVDRAEQHIDQIGRRAGIGRAV